MWGAAPQRSRLGVVLTLALGLALACASGASSAVSAKPPKAVWAVELDAASAKTFTRSEAARLRAAGINVILADAKLSGTAITRARKTAAGSGLLFVSHFRAPAGTAVAARCRAARSAGSKVCAVRAASPAEANRLARTQVADLVVVRVSGPGALGPLRGRHTTRVLAIAGLSAAPRFDTARWQKAVAVARLEPALDLAVHPSGRTGKPALSSYLGLLRGTSILSVPTSNPTAAAPGTPGGVGASATTRNGVTLSWQPVPGAVEYGIYVGGTLVGRSLVSSFTAGDLACGTTHRFEVDAVSSSGARSQRSVISATTTACAGGGGGGGGAPTTPTAPSGLVATGMTNTTISVAWQPSSSADVAGYGLYRGGAAAGSTSGTAAAFSGLTCATTYSLAVDAFTAAGLRSTQAIVSATTSACAPGAPVDTLPPTIPLGIQVSASSATSITVGWAASTDNVGVTGYTAYRNGSSVGTTAARSYSFSGLTCGTTYTFGVEAFDAAGNSSGRATATAATNSCSPPADTQPPSVPQGMTFSGRTQTSVSLIWLASTDNVGVAGYRLLRNGVSVGTVTTLGYTYGGLTCGTSYTFALEAYDASGNASNRAQATGTTSTDPCGGGGAPPPPPPPPPPPVGNTAQLWVDTNGGSCTRSASPVGYADAAACGSLNAAYQAASNSDTILVRGGSYGSQLVTEKTAASAPGIRIASTTGETVSYARVEIKGSFLQLTGPFVTNALELDGSGNSAANRPVEEVLVEHFEVDGQGLNGSPIAYLRGVDRVTWRNGEIHNNKNMSLVYADQDAGAGALNNVTFDRMSIHDALLDSGSAAHTECLYAQGINNLRITNSHFYRCAVMDVFITRWTDTDIDPVGGYIENNIFEAPLAAGNVCCAYYAFHFRDGGEPAPDINNWDFRYNLFAGTLSFGGNENLVEGGGLRVVGNVFLGSSACKTGATWTANVHSDGSTCSGTGETNSNSTSIRSGYAGYVGSTATNNNWHLTATSILIDKGNLNSYPSTDHDGNNRYTGNGPDAGPHEYR